MKRKIFSKLLMGAILFASVSAFVSCKDYDDDINANKADIKAAQEQLATLSSSLTSLQQKLETEKAALQKELADAKSSLETQIANAKAELNAAIAKKADQSTVDALVTRVANLETDLAATKEAFNAKIEAINNALAKLEALIEKKADQTYVDQAIATLTAAISGKVSTEDFNAFKAEVAKIETNLSNLTTLVNTKADQATVDAAFAAINKEIAQLQEKFEAALAQQKKDFDAAIAQIKTDIENGKEQVNKELATKADKAALDALTEKVNGLSEAVAALQAAVATKADKTEVEALNKKLDEKVADLQNQINKLVTPEQLNAAVTKLENAIAALESATNAKIDLMKSETEKELQKKANQADFAELKAAFEALKASYERHGENIALMISDAINALDSKLTAIIDTKVDQDEFDATVEDLQGQIDDITEDIAGILETLIAVNGDIDNLNAYIKAVAGKSKEVDSVLNSLITNNALAIEALDIQVAAIEGFLADFLNEDGSSTLKDEFSKASQAVQDSLAKQNEYRAAAVAEVVAKIVEVKTDLSDLNSKLYDLENGDITKLKAQFANIDNIVQDKINANLSAMALFVSRMLTSVTLIPKNYIDGIEAIKFRSIRYIPQVTDYSIVPAEYADATGYPTADYVESQGTAPAFAVHFGDHQLANMTVNGKVVSPVIIDNKKTTVQYRLSPKYVSLDQIDKDNIKMYAHYAKTETRAVATGENKPVKPSFVSLDKGVLTVSLEKTVTDPIYFEGEGKQGIIAALSVPRKADPAKGVESTEVFSEYSLLDEETIVPRIAALPWVNNKVAHNAASPMDYHFIDSLHIFKSMTDANLYVKAEIDYDKPYDLLQLVTGCYGVFNEETKAITGHNEIKKDELAQYGLKFKFALPKTYAAKSATNSNFNYTDQQPFAQLNGSIIQAKLPQDQLVYGNRAVIGKEPIVRVMLVDTVRHYLVDQAYFKVKFKDTLLDKDPINVEYSETQTLDCGGNTLNMKWDKFINLVYAQLKDSEGETTGMSWEQFRKYYPQNNVWRTKVNGANTNYQFEVGSSYCSEGTTGSGRGMVDIWWLSSAASQDYAPYSDANELYWYLDADDIKEIKKDGDRSKTFTTVVTFKSNDSKVYGPINLTLKLTVTLPNKPQIVGYNENQWFASTEKFYVQPVQYGTTNNKDVRPEKVEYDFNITQQFTVNTSTDFGYNKNNGTWTNWIVKGLPYDCGSWDVQFAKPANGKGYRSAYQAADVNIASQLTAENLAYRYVNANNAQALQLWWKADDNHYSWTNWTSNDVNNPFFILHGDKSTANQIIPLLNDLSQDNRSDGWTPEKTYDDAKAIDMTVWGRYNKYNYEPITSFKAYLVTPVRINFTAPGAFEDNWVSGTVVDAAGKLSITDFVGYAVAKSLSSFTAAQRGQERYKYAEKLWNYYGLEDPVFNLGDNDVIYGLKLQNGNLVVDNNVTVNNTGSAVINGGMKGSQVAAATAGGYTPSLTMDGGNLLYKNKQGREFEQPYNVFVPVTIKHIFGTLKTYVPFPVYPKGKAAGDGYEVKAGPEVTSRLAK